MSLIKSALSTPVYIDTGLKSGTTYYYWITSVNNTGESAHSDQIAVKARNALMYVTVTGAAGDVELVGGGVDRLGALGSDADGSQCDRRWEDTEP